MVVFGNQELPNSFWYYVIGKAEQRLLENMYVSFL